MKTPEEKRREYFAQNPEVYTLYREVKEINEKREGLRYDLLRDIKAYAIKHTEFYRNYSVDDTFPVMTKTSFIQNRSAITSNEVFPHPFHISSTSGSTGIPFYVEQNRDKRLRLIAELKVFGEYALYPSHEKMLQLRGYNGEKIDRSVDERENIWRYDITDMSDRSLDKLSDFIHDWKPTVILGYTSAVEILASHLLNKGKLFDFGCKSVIVGAEMLTDEIADKIKKVFHCPVFDRYSNMEMGIYAQREHGKTNFRLNTASYFFEVLKLDRDEPADEHEIGRIVVTDLFNHAFPMIRYDTGDLGSYCMSGKEMELDAVWGRKLDIIYDMRGNMLNPHVITRTLKHIAKIGQFQLIQQGEKSYLLKIKTDDVIDERTVLTILSDVLGKSAEIAIEYIDEIPVLNSQKRKCVINEWRK